MTSKSKQPRKRKEQIELLEFHLSNPGRFSILILGGRGTGKKYWIKENKVHQVIAGMAEATTAFWEEAFKKADQGILLIEDVDNLTSANQEILFSGLATTDGKFGFDHKSFEVRAVFTSSKDISMLRDSEKYLSHKFFDRISQLVVRFPDFSECSNTIERDFRHTWDKFKFDTAYPALIVPWLRQNAHKLHGSFRDLDKLCINWNNYQLMGMPEETILQRIKEDFSAFYHFPETKKEAIFEVHFSKDKTYQQIQYDFKMQYKAWAKQEFGSLKKAGQVLGIGHRTMEGWSR